MGSSRHGFVPPQFALKHKEFAHLREVKMFPNALNPHKEEARALVRAMIDRVMELHRDLRWFHIGCDEVRRGPGRCCESRAVPLHRSGAQGRVWVGFRAQEIPAESQSR